MIILQVTPIFVIVVSTINWCLVNDSINNVDPSAIGWAINVIRKREIYGNRR